MSSARTFSDTGRHPVAASIFREYDIRGVFGQTLTSETAYLIGRAFATRASMQPAAPIIIARDGRLSSPVLADALCRGILDSGVDVINIGIGPTPMLYFATHMIKAAGGIMVTGSHNPPKHNGFKFVLNHKPFFGEDIQLLRMALENGAFKDGKGKIESLDISQRYVDTLLKAYGGDKPLATVWDAGNGATGNIVDVLCQRLPGKHIALNGAIDGTFPVHHPDPSVPENLMQVAEMVRAKKLDVGIAFDGDGDRIGVVDNKGEMLFGDQLLALYAADVLHNYPGALIIADVKASQVLFNEIERLGGVPVMWKTGHSHIKAKMASTGARLAGEMSGHMFFADMYFGYDDALYAAIRLLSILSRSECTLSELRTQLPKAVNTPEIRFDCPEERKFAVIDEVRARLENAMARFNDIDGVRVMTSDGWWLLRASNTQAALVARCEAKDEDGLQRLRRELSQQLAESGISF